MRMAGERAHRPKWPERADGSSGAGTPSRRELPGADAATKTQSREAPTEVVEADGVATAGQSGSPQKELRAGERRDANR
jgi:hypothetical protein